MNAVRTIIAIIGLTLGWPAAMAQTLEDAYAALYGDRDRHAVEVAERVTAALPDNSETTGRRKAVCTISSVA